MGIIPMQAYVYAWVWLAALFVFLGAAVEQEKGKSDEGVEREFEALARNVAAALLGVLPSRVLVAWNGGKWDAEDYEKWHWQEFGAVTINEFPRPRRAVLGLITQKEPGSYEIDVSVTDDPEEIAGIVEDVRLTRLSCRVWLSGGVVSM